MTKRPIEPVVVARVGELAPGTTRKFTLRLGNDEEEAFVVNWRGNLYAYVNRCRHVPMTMDWIDNQFLTEDGIFIQCATHGAFYRPDTGQCVEGPPLGKSLLRIGLAFTANEVVAIEVDSEAA